MKKNIMIFAFSFFIIGSTTSQCCPTIDSLVITPENPSTTDSIYLVPYLTLTSGMYYIDYEIEHGSNNDITIKECYWKNDAAVISYFSNSINLGVKEAGTYTVKYTALLGEIYNLCQPVDSNSRDLVFDVNVINNINKVDENEVTCFPNPLKNQELWISSSNHIETILIMDVQGKVVKRIDGLDTIHHKVDTNNLEIGTYYIKVIDKSSKGIVKKLVKLE